jgi:L-fuconolactonase
MKLDAHQHFWRYHPEQYPWIPTGSPLARDWLPADLDALQEPLSFDGSIAVQARQGEDDSRNLLRLAAPAPRIVGVVGWVDLRSPRVEEELASLAAQPKFVGVRHVVQDEADPAFVLGKEFVRGIGRLRDFDLTYDLLIYPHQLPAAIKLVEKFPDQPFVLDHLAKPRIRDRVFQPWKDLLRELASAPNVWCKVSGMITEAQWDTWTPEELRPYLNIAFECFGLDRLMFGSDWPVCLLAGSYERVHQLLADYVARLPAEEQAAFWGGNCAEFYGVPNS